MRRLAKTGTSMNEANSGTSRSVLLQQILAVGGVALAIGCAAPGLLQGPVTEKWTSAARAWRRRSQARSQRSRKTG
jgi:hypothetical protein